jgi:hypothetical protein
VQLRRQDCAHPGRSVAGRGYLGSGHCTTSQVNSIFSLPDIRLMPHFDRLCLTPEGDSILAE